MKATLRIITIDFDSTNQRLNNFEFSFIEGSLAPKQQIILAIAINISNTVKSRLSISLFTIISVNLQCS